MAQLQLSCVYLLHKHKRLITKPPEPGLLEKSPLSREHNVYKIKIVGMMAV
jgi:hypothetical protein